MATFGTGAVSLRVCQRCGIQGAYLEFPREQITNLWVCDSCLDDPNPYQVGWRPRIDGIALRYPNPDVNIALHITFDDTDYTFDDQDTTWDHN